MKTSPCLPLAASFIAICPLAFCDSARAAILVVDNASAQAADSNAGTRDKPFKSIDATAKIAKAGDTVRRP